MIVYDTLSELESYLGPFPEIGVIISVLDRSLPYQEGPGRYDTPEKSDVVYLIDEFLTSSSGFSPEIFSGKRVMEVVLDGDEIISVAGSVFRMGEGTFLIYKGDAETKRGMCWSVPSHAKAVRFIF